MKKLLTRLIVLISVICLLFTACKKATKEEITETTTIQENITIEEITSIVETTIIEESSEMEIIEEEIYEEETYQEDNEEEIIEDEEVPETIYEEEIEENYDSYEDDDIYSLAYRLYGMEDYNVTKALKLITYEGYGDDSYLDYLMACTVINHYIDNPYEELYSNWGGGDDSYNEWTFSNVGIADHAYWALEEALLDLDPNAWDCHGIIPENGYTGGVQLLSEAYYISYAFDIIYAVWPRDAGWYQVSNETEENSNMAVMDASDSYDYSSGSILTPEAGINYYNGILETYYNLPMEGVVDWMHSLGYGGEYWERSDGVKMLGDYIMVAADYGWMPKGSIVETSLGTGIVCDTGGGGWYWFDIAVTW